MVIDKVYEVFNPWFSPHHHPLTLPNFTRYFITPDLLGILTSSPIFLKTNYGTEQLKYLFTVVFI